MTIPKISESILKSGGWERDTGLITDLYPKNRINFQERVEEKGKIDFTQSDVTITRLSQRNLPLTPNDEISIP